MADDQEDKRIQELKDIETIEKGSRWNEELGRYVNKIRSPFAPSNLANEEAKKRLRKAEEEGRFGAPGFSDQGRFFKKGGKVSTAKVGKRMRGFD